MRDDFPEACKCNPWNLFQFHNQAADQQLKVWLGVAASQSQDAVTPATNRKMRAGYLEKAKYVTQTIVILNEYFRLGLQLHPEQAVVVVPNRRERVGSQVYDVGTELYSYSRDAWPRCSHMVHDGFAWVDV